jgi:hypothetical protein
MRLNQAPESVLWLDASTVHDGDFKRRLARVSRDLRVLSAPVLFGSTQFLDWRESAISAESICRIETEPEELLDCAICEAYEQKQRITNTAIFGGQSSSYSNRATATVTRIDQEGPSVPVDCGTLPADFKRIALGWGCFVERYDATLTRPPLDEETILGRDSRFVRTGKFERKGRRQVYLETTTGRYWYVDNLHYGSAAHLEVFDSYEVHMGEADLDGNVIGGTGLAGRVIRW